MNIHKAKDIVISAFNSSYYRKTTESEEKAIRKITKKFGDEFVQSCYREIATRNSGGNEML